MRPLRNMVLALGCALSAMVLTLAIVIEYDSWVADYVGDAINQRLSVFGDCVFSGRVHRISLLRGVLVMRDIVVRPHHRGSAGDAWSYTVDELRVSWPWAAVLHNRLFALDVVCPHVNIMTRCSRDECAIQEHIRACLANKPQYFAYKPTHVRVNKLETHIASAADDVVCRSDATLEVIVEPRVQKTALSLKHAQMYVRGRQVLDQVTGVARYTVHDGNAHAVCDGQAVLLLGTAREHMNYHVEKDARGVRALAYNDDRSVHFGADYAEFLNLIVHVPLARLVPTAPNVILSLHGKDSVIAVTGELQQEYATGTWCNGAECFALDLTTSNSLSVSATVGDSCVAVTIAGDGQPSASAHCAYDGTYTATVHSSLATMVGLKDPRVSIDGTLEFQGRLASYPRCLVSMKEGHLRLPQAYTFIPDAHAEVVWNAAGKNIQLLDVVGSAQQGFVSCSSATVRYDDRGIAFIHAPLFLHDLFVHRRKDFYATVSGDIVALFNRDERSSLRGHCFIDQCQVRENIFSPGMKDDLVAATLNPFAGVRFAATTDLDVTLASQTPIEVKTSFLQARCMVNVSLRGTIAQPEVYGTIDCVDGQLMFPYQPMHIVQGKIFFVDNQLSDPLIEITARAKIKHYTILMQISGTAQQPTITFQSSPALQDEQITSLLFGGTEDGAVAIAVPLSLSGELERLLLGSADEASHVLFGLERILKPFGNVRIVPSFSDQSARGGVRGALRVEVNDRLSGLIQQNFSLTEDTLIEAAYKVTDNVTIRGMRDERGDLGGEVEMSLTW